MSMEKITGLTAATLLAISIPFTGVRADDPLPDYVTKRIEWRSASGELQAPIHVSLMPDGRLLFFESPFTMTPSPFWMWRNEDLPDAVTVEPISPPLVNYPPGVQYGNLKVIDSIACAGHGLMEDGSVLVVGGTRLVADKPVEELSDYAAIFGFSDALSFSPQTDAWSALSKMTGAGPLGFTGPGARWYPTVTRLASGGMMVTGGLEMIWPAKVPNSSVEIYDPAFNAWEVVSTYEETPPSIYNRDYSHVFQLPTPVSGDFDILMMGEFGQPVFMSTEGSERWRVSAALRPGTTPGESVNHGTSTALLPIRLDGRGGYANGAIVMAGGHHMTDHEHNIDIYDPSADQWMQSIDMGIRRHHPALVLLPDSRVLLITGHNDFGENPGYAEYLDPADGFSLRRGSVDIPEIRGYHTVTVLLPDGRVLLGSGNDGGAPGNEKPNFRYYYPDYMLEPRPALLLAQETLTIGDYFWTITGDKTPISELVLVALGSMTHSFDMNQRVVQVEMVASGDYGEHSYQIAKAPASPEMAPPGFYMLFALDADRVPSVAKIVRLSM